MNDLQSSGGGLRTARRNRRMSAGGVLSVQKTRQGGSRAFAQAVIDRYKAWEERRPSLKLVFWRFVRGVSAGPLHQHIQLLKTRVISRFSEWPRSLRAYGTDTNARVGTQAEHLTTDRLDGRVVVRRERIESSPDAIVLAGRRPPRVVDARLPPPHIGVQAAHDDEPHADSRKADLNLLTDQIIQTIDRRIVAHRERMGRI